jgi:hypothetical protein
MLGTLSTSEVREITDYPEHFIRRHAKDFRAHVRGRGRNRIRITEKNALAFQERYESLSAEPADPDLIRVRDARKEFGISAQTIYRLVKSGNLALHHPWVLDDANRAYPCSALSKTELSRLFVKRPKRGEPIVLTDDKDGGPGPSRWYLYEDSPHGYSRTTWNYWAEKDSECHTGKALRLRPVFVMGECKRGPKKKRIVGLAEDLDRISAGKEGTMPQVGLVGHWARKNRKDLLKKTEKFFRSKIVPKLPLKAAEGIRLCDEAEIPVWLAHKMREKFKIKSKRTGGGKSLAFWWVKGNQTIPVNGSQALTEANGNGRPLSNISSNISRTKKREAYKREQMADILSLVKRHKRQGKNLKECFEETAFEMHLRPGAVKMAYYRNKSAE